MHEHAVSHQQYRIATWEDHTAQGFVSKDVDASLRTMTSNPHVVNVPVGIGGRGLTQARDYCSRHFIGQNPNDLRLDVVSRTEGRDQLVREMIVLFTYDVGIPLTLLHVPPTGKKVQLPEVAIIAFRDGTIDSEHLYWDQASVLVQLGLLSPDCLPVLGTEQDRAAKLSFRLIEVSHRAPGY